MAIIRNNFIKSKMNKDLDSRLVPPGEYREAQNVAVSKSEGADVGSLENILGNFELTDFGLSAITNLDIIGTFMDLSNDRIFVFMTNYVDTSADKLSNFASTNASCYVAVYNTSDLTYNLLVTGYFLNLSKTHPVLGVNLIENNLFWTDNRNQPRKIDVSSAIANSSYYTNEDQISVSKYYPYSPIDLYRSEVTALAITNGGTSGTYQVENGNPTTGGTGSGLTVNVTSVSGAGPTIGDITGIEINQPGYGYTNGDTVSVAQRTGDGSGAVITLTVEAVSTMQDVVSELLPDGTTNNPLYNANWPGDKDFLKDKFVRFSYRFKFEDNTYSLIAPFTQECFVPQQDGYFIDDDPEQTYKSTEVEFMQNKINNIILVLNVPNGSTNWDDVNTNLKVAEIEIIYKDANEQTLKVLDSIPSSEFIDHNQLFYEYQSRKPFKTLPTSDLLRVYDQSPVRALAQETVGNRVVYGNFVDKHTPPESLDYQVKTGFKLTETPAASTEASFVRKEYQNHSLKQNRTYQVGVVLSDRYGRQSDVILSAVDSASISAALKGSTIFNPFKTGTKTKTTSNPVTNFSDYSIAATATSNLLQATGVAADTWPGDELQIQFNTIIDSVKNTSIGTPGLYSTTNPLGWFTYKIVVKQTQIDYYNVYFPGVLSGYVDGESRSPTAASLSEPVAHFAVFSDNINKIPKDNTLVGPNQNIFRTGRPSFNDDPSYYQFTDTSGNLFQADPYSEEGERLLKERDRERDLDSGSQVNNSSVEVSPRVLNYFTNSGVVPTLAQYYPDTVKDVVTTIGTGTELGLWDASAKPPYNTAPVFYNYQNNPFVAKLKLNNPANATEVQQYGQPGPSSNAGQIVLQISIDNAGSGYLNGNVTNVPVEITTATGAGSNLLVDYTGNGSFEVTQVGVADIGEGWEVGSHTGTIMHGDNNCTLDITVTKQTWGIANSAMAPIFSCLETTPLESKLDIYWETSTAGLISTLNTNIEASDTTTPAGFEKSGGGAIAYTQNEGMALTQDLTDDFTMINFAGAAVTANVTMVLTSVLDGLGNERKSDFNLTNVSAGTYKITNASYFYFGPDAGIRENFSFFITVTAPSPDYTDQGTFVSRILELSSATGTPCLLSNVTPTITPTAAGPNLSPASTPACNDSVAISGVSTGEQLVATFSAVNGANASDSRKTNDLTWNIENPPSTDYYLQGTRSQPWITNLYIKGGSDTTGAAQAIDVQVTDAGGLSVICRLTIDANA